MATAARRTVKKDADSEVHPLADLIPPPEVGETYVNRIMKGSTYTDYQLLQYAQKEGRNVLTYGDTGPGKTRMFMSYASSYRMPIVTIAGNGGIDPNSFWGGYQYDPETDRVKWVDSDVTRVIRHGHAILYIDEINYMPPKTAGAFNTLLDDRRFITILELGNLHVQAGPNLLIGGSFNPDYEGTRRMNKAFKNRWPLKFYIDYDPEVEKQLVFMPVLLEIADKLRLSRKAGDLETPVATNMLRDFEQFLADLGLDFAIEYFLASFDSEEVEAVRAVFELHRSDLEQQADEMLSDTD